MQRGQSRASHGAPSLINSPLWRSYKASAANHWLRWILAKALVSLGELAQEKARALVALKDAHMQAARALPAHELFRSKVKTHST